MNKIGLFFTIFLISIKGIAQVDMSVKGTLPTVDKGCPYYSVKITLNSGQIFTGLIISENCDASTMMTDENLMKQIKTVTRGGDNSIEMRTDYNVLQFLNNEFIYYDTFSVIKIQKIEVKTAMVLEKTQYTDFSKFSNYIGSKRMVAVMKNQKPINSIVINFSDDDCESLTNYVLVNYHPKVNEIDLRKFAEANKKIFLSDCDETNNESRIKKLLEPLNIVFFKENLE